MQLHEISISSLEVNRANDRHGELENETAAIGWLFSNREVHMRNLAKDIVDSSGIYEPPLVMPRGHSHVVFDGNRRVTCLKLLDSPRRAPNSELQKYFVDLRAKWVGDFPTTLSCQVETDRDRIDDILYRRHTGGQSGVGQSTWDDRMKENFVQRTGRGTGLNIADAIERRLAAAGMLPKKKIPRSNLNRLLSAEAFRNRLGITVRSGRVELTHAEQVVLPALKRVADDMSQKKVVLGHIWDVEGKKSYLDALASEGILPIQSDILASATVFAKQQVTRPTPAVRPTKRNTVIPQTTYAVAWTGQIQRHKSIWDELQFHLDLDNHPNACAVLLRVLFELSIENYLSRQKPRNADRADTLAKKAKLVAADLYEKGAISKNYLMEIEKLHQAETIVSAHTLNRYVHSPNFSPSPGHLTALWDSLSELVVLCLNA